MNESEARVILQGELAKYREWSYNELVARIGVEPFRTEIAKGDALYQVEIDVIWDVDPDGDVRVLGSIDDGGWRAFAPLCDDFIKASDGSTSST